MRRSGSSSNTFFNGASAFRYDTRNSCRGGSQSRHHCQERREAGCRRTVASSSTSTASRLLDVTCNRDAGGPAECARQTVNH
jgi:hypothetical protein